MYSLRLDVLMSLITLVHSIKVKLKRPSLALLRCKPNFSIFELGLISVQIKLSNF